MKREMIDVSDPRVCMIGHPAPGWMVNYADLMTELTCFFIVLYALSAALNKNVQKAKKDVEEAMKQEQVQGEVKVSKEGMTITLEEKGENVFFQSGSADLSPRMEEILVKIAPTLKGLAKQNFDVIVEGHTDDLPIRTPQFQSNWDLSTARATHVVKYLIEQYQFPPQRMGAIGYGEFHPLVPNDSEEHRSMNRRVVFFVKNPPPNTKGDSKGKKEVSKEETSTVVTEAAPPENVDANASSSQTDAPPGDQTANQQPVEEPAVGGAQ